MGPFEDQIRSMLEVGGVEPSAERLLDNGRLVVDVTDQLNRLNGNVAALARAIAASQAASVAIAAEIDKLRSAKGVG